MDNAEEIFHFLEEFSKRKQKTIPQELNDYLAYVARTGDPVYQWSLVKSLFKEKLLNVITDFYDTTPGIDIPPYPNVDPFNYDIMKNSLLERLDSFTSAPFTVQRICELLTYPRKQYNRVDKFMRAIEKNILVVSTREPGFQRLPEPENGEPMEQIVNGSDNNSEYNVDVEMEDMSWKDNPVSKQGSEPQPGSSDAHISVDDIEVRLHAKQETSLAQDKAVTQYESVTPPELNITENTEDTEKKPKESASEIPSTSSEDGKNNNSSEESPETKMDVEMKADALDQVITIPEIKVDDAETTEQKLSEEANLTKNVEPDNHKETIATTELTNIPTDESSSDSSKVVEAKHNTELSSSEESSSSDNTDGNSNSPKTDEHIDVQDESQSNKPIENSENSNKEIDTNAIESINTNNQPTEEEAPTNKIEPDNYSISDVQSELPKVSVVVENKTEELEMKENISDKEKEETEIVTTAPNAES